MRPSTQGQDSSRSISPVSTLTPTPPPRPSSDGSESSAGMSMRGITPIPPSTRRETRNGRRWNTPQELQQLLFFLPTRDSKGNQSQQPDLPPLVFSDRQMPEISDVDSLALNSEQSLSKLSPKPSPKLPAAGTELFRKGAGRGSATTPSSLQLCKTYDSRPSLIRNVGSIVHGDTLASFDDGVYLITPQSGDLMVNVELRLTTTNVIFRCKEGGKDRTHTRIPLTSIYECQNGMTRTSPSLHVYVVEDSSRPVSTGPGSPLLRGRPAARERSLSIDDCERYDIVCNNADTISEIHTSIIQQQVKAFHAEVSRVRKSLIPAGSRTLHIVHYNDIYHLNVFKTEEPCGGVSRFFHQLEEIRKTKNPLVLFSGDFVGPSLMSVITKGKQMIDAMNFIGTHYGVFGNHEFDFGLRNLERIVHGYTQGEYIFAGSHTEWLMSNMDGKNGQPLGGVTRKKIIEWNGITVGLLGLCENWLPHCPRLDKNEAVYRDIIATGEELARQLKAEGAELVIALTHNRIDLDRQVTAACPSIDLLLGGHDHFYKKDLERRVIKSGEEFQWLSEVQISLGEAPGIEPTIICRTHPISSDLPENKMINKLVQRYGEKVQEKMGKVIGRTTVPLDSTEEACRFQEGVLTNFFSDLMASETGADFAVLGGAAVSGKAVKEPGHITIGDVFNWFPHETKVQVIELQGKHIPQFLTVSAKELPEEAPSFPHPSSSLTFTINMLKKPVTVENIRIDGQPIDPERKYKVAVTDFVAAGKERFKWIRESCRVLTEAEHAEQFSMWILEYFRQRKGQRADGVTMGSGKTTTDIAHNGNGRLSLSAGAEDADEDDRVTDRSSVLIQPQSQKYDEPEESFSDLDVETTRKLITAFGKLAEEIEVVTAQQVIKDAVKDLLECDRATIFLADQVNKMLKFIPDGVNKEIAIPLNTGIAGHCATYGRVINIPDAYQDERFNQDVDRQTGYRTRTILACPVTRKGDGRVMAVMQAVNKNKGSFTERDSRLLSLFGKQAGAHLYNAELFNSVKKNQEATQTLLRVAKDIASDISMDMKTMVACIMSGASQLLRCDRSSLFLLDSKAGEMWTIVIDPNNGTEHIIRLPLGAGLAGHVATSGVILNLKDAYDCPLFDPAWDKKTGYRTTQVLCVPIFTQEGSSDMLGVLQFINKLDGTDFSKQDEQMATAFAAFAGISIANTQEIDLLKLNHDDAFVQEIPVSTLGRINIKGGWSTAKKYLKEGVLKLDHPVFSEISTEIAIYDGEGNVSPTKKPPVSPTAGSLANTGSMMKHFKDEMERSDSLRLRSVVKNKVTSFSRFKKRQRDPSRRSSQGSAGCLWNSDEEDESD